MASGYKQRGEAFSVAKTALAPSTFSVGDPVVYDDLPAVAMSGSSKAGTTEATIWTYGIYNLKVNAPTGQAAVAGATIYFIPTAANGTHLTTHSGATGAVRWGYTLVAISASTAPTVNVKVGY